MIENSIIMHNSADNWEPSIWNSVNTSDPDLFWWYRSTDTTCIGNIARLAMVSAKVGLKIIKSKPKAMMVEMVELDDAATAEKETSCTLAATLTRNRSGHACDHRESKKLLLWCWGHYGDWIYDPICEHSTSTRSLFSCMNRKHFGPTKAITKKLQSFVNKCLRPFMGIH